MPSEWEAYLEPERALKLEKLRQAKDVIRKIREKKYVPSLAGDVGGKSGSSALGYRSPKLARNPAQNTQAGSIARE